jgi:hypothetical protein
VREFEPVSINTHALRCFLRIRLVASTPSTPGIAMSIRITSGCSASAC